MYGDQYPGKIEVITFRVDAASPENSVTTTTETALACTQDSGATGVRNHWVCPWNARIVEVYAEAQMVASGDIVSFRVQRWQASTGSTLVVPVATDALWSGMISNVVAAAEQEYIRFTATAANQVHRKRFGNFDDADLLDVQGTAASVFEEATALLAAGDAIQGTYKMGAAADQFSHGTVKVTVVRRD